MKHFLIVTILLGSLAVGRAGWLDKLGFGTPATTSPATNQASALTAGVAALSSDQVVAGLKEALSKGVQNAVSGLGHDGGFLTNLNVKIPMPEKLRTVETTLRKLKQEKLADEFVTTMNHAAEQAVPEAAAVFGDSIKQMSIADAKTILTGTNNAATEYFRKTTQTNLYAKFLPIVKTATDKAGVTAAYKNMMGKITGTSSFTSLLGNTGLIKPEDLDVDAYVTGKAMDGLFTMVAAEEASIRANPLARTTDLLQKVFGSVGK
jgi:hypothetical protein